MSVPRELQMPGRTRSMDAELRGERSDLVVTIAMVIPLLILGAALIAQGGLLNYVYAALALIPAIVFIARSVVRLGSM